jgi:RNA polymerase sigma factor (sigma-70 family)
VVLGNSDVELLGLFRGGDLATFTTIYRRHGQSVLRYIWARQRTLSGADDILQSTFLTAWSKRRQARIVDESLLPWLLTITRNHLANESRRARRRATQELPRELPHQSSPEPETEAWIDMAISALSPLDQKVCRLCLIEGYSYAEAAALLSTSPAAVGKRLQRAKARLQSVLPRGTGR